MIYLVLRALNMKIKFNDNNGFVTTLSTNLNLYYIYIRILNEKFNYFRMGLVRKNLKIPRIYTGITILQYYTLLGPFF